MSQTELAPALRPAAEVRSLFNAVQVRRYRAIPLRREGKAVVVAMSNPSDLASIEEMEFLVGARLVPLEADAAELERAIRYHYAVSLLPAVREDPVAPSDSPIVEVQRLLFAEAARLRASDIHVDPGDRSSRVRFRVDGHLLGDFRLPLWLHERLVARIKVIARLDISERRLPQDGHLVDPASGFEARLSTLPTCRGEALVLRLFGDRGAMPTLEGIGCPADIRNQLRAIFERPQGVLLVTGPTGSGKTTTLYAILNELCRRPLNIVTIEDPVEYRVDGIRQVQVDERSNLSFHAALRATLRQDPDVILVGEIRDAETARIAFHAGLTGHLVLSTVHATEALATLVRLVELGVDRGVIASTLIGAVAQRLLGRNCASCRVPDDPPSYLLERMGIDSSLRSRLRTARGCLECSFRGTSGRIPLLEVLEPGREVRCELVAGKDSDLRRVALDAGFVPIMERARECVVSGEVTLGEAYRTCYFGDGA